MNNSLAIARREFAAACESAGVAFVGPTPEQIRAFGLKHAAREIAQKAGVAGVPGSGLLASAGDAARAAAAIGYPVMLKSTAGGGGIGMRRCDSEAELSAAFASVSHLGRSHFGDDRLFVEKAIVRARHVEVQIFGDGRGRVSAPGADVNRTRAPPGSSRQISMLSRRTESKNTLLPSCAQRLRRSRTSPEVNCVPDVRSVMGDADSGNVHR